MQKSRSLVTLNKGFYKENEIKANKTCALNVKFSIKYLSLSII